MAFSKAYILRELQRIAAEIGKAPGRARFYDETGIREADWLGRYWIRWSDALREAGLEPNALNPKIDDAVLLDALLDETRRIARFPTNPDLRMRRQSDPSFPSHNTFYRLGNRQQRIELLHNHCKAKPDDNADVLAILETLLSPASSDASSDDGEYPVSDTDIGYVYLIKSGRYYKIGRTNALGRRERELAIQLPERAKTVHAIKTDDPPGIEHYWHRRFADRRVRSDAEWFSLTPEDVSAFRRRKFQ